MLIITISIFVCVTLGVMALYWLMFRPPSAATERLRRLGESEGGVLPSQTVLVEEGAGGGFAERMAGPLHRIAPPSAAEARKLQKLLMQAGYRSESSPVIYRALQLASLVCFPAFVGLGLNAALVRVCVELKDVHPDISEEFDLTNLEIRVGRERDEALRNLSERTGVDDLRSLVAMLIQADRFGTSIAKAVRVYADSLRMKRRQRAEQAAQKAAVKLLLPLALFLFPTLFIIILGPAALNLADTFMKQ
ncbi:MAG: type II secretion system F family protein [Acidobacteria bacterium]|nr:type II secretion system F family protein [Acidobacteriota bacterium]